MEPVFYDSIEPYLNNGRDKMKKWYHSKMLYTNIIGLVVIIVSVVFSRKDIADEIVAIEGSVLAIINFILRLTTNQGLER